MSDEFKITGLKELDRLLKVLPGRVAKKVLKSGVRAGARVIIVQARRNLPSNYKSLKKSIGVKVLKPLTPHTVVALIGPRVDKQLLGFLGPIVEFGTLASRTEPLASATRRKTHSVPLPAGLKPIAFLRPAVDTTKRKQLDAIGQKIKERVAIEVKRLK